MSASPKAHMTYRKMIESDLDAVMAIELKTYPHPWTRGIFEDSLKYGHLCRVVVHQEQILAYAVMIVAAGEAHILNICVDSEYQSRGIGHNLMNRLFASARRYNVQSIFLEARASNKIAMSLYQKLGFNEVGLRRNYYPAKKGREDAVILALELRTICGVK